MTSCLADKIEHWPTDRLIPNARNARQHSDAQIAQIAASIAEFGFSSPRRSWRPSASNRTTPTSR